MFDPNIQVPYSDTYTVGFQRAARRARSAIEVRYVGTRNRDQWDDLQLQREPNILENGFLDEFKLAQAEPAGEHRGGCGTTATRARSPTSDRARARSRCRSTWRSSAASPRRRRGDAAQLHVDELDELELHQPARPLHGESVHAGRHEREHRPGGRPGARRRTSLAAGLPRELLPRQPGHARRRARHRPTAASRSTTRSSCSSAAGSSNGLQFDVNYVVRQRLRATRATRSACRAARRRAAPGDVTHALKGTLGLRAAVRPRQAVRHRTSNAWVDGIVGGWVWSGTTRIQSGDLIDLGNVRVVGMTRAGSARRVPAAQGRRRTSSTRGRRTSSTNTIKAYSTSATSPTGYGASDAPTGRYFAPANGPDCIETINGNYGDCGVRTLHRDGTDPLPHGLEPAQEHQLPAQGASSR